MHLASLMRVKGKLTVVTHPFTHCLALSNIHSHVVRWSSPHKSTGTRGREGEGQRERLMGWEVWGPPADLRSMCQALKCVKAAWAGRRVHGLG